MFRGGLSDPRGSILLRRRRSAWPAQSLWLRLQVEASCPGWRNRRRELFGINIFLINCTQLNKNCLRVWESITTLITLVDCEIKGEPLTLTRTLKVLTPSSTALSMSSIKLSVEPRSTIVAMAPSSFSVRKI